MTDTPIANAPNAFIECDAARAQELHVGLKDLAIQLANTPDSEFPEQFCRRASALIGVEHFIIGRLNTYSNMMRTVCFVSDGALADNIVYQLRDTPCARVMENHTCVYSSGVADAYPRDEMLQEMKIQSYIGAPITGNDGKRIGIVAGFGESAIADTTLGQKIVEFFRNRIACCLEASETLERYVMAYSGAEEGFWDWDLKTGGMVVSESVGEMLGLAPRQRPRDLQSLENLIHAEDREKFVTAVRWHAKTGDQFSLILRFRGADAEYRWVRASGRGVLDNAGRASRMIGSLINVDQWVKEGTLAPDAKPKTFLNGSAAEGRVGVDA
ncbi:MAG: PAS domain-containing protein [Pseudomonadota bacterium]